MRGLSTGADERDEVSTMRPPGKCSNVEAVSGTLTRQPIGVRSPVAGR